MNTGAIPPSPDKESRAYGSGCAPHGGNGESAPVRLYDLARSARYLGVSWWTTRELVLDGTIPAVRLPAPRATDGRMLRRILIDVADLDRLIAKWKDRPAQL
jgi:hypothetical protein